jgi:hypothetical protein
MNNSLTLFSEDAEFSAKSLPEIRVYADRPNLFAKYSNAQIKERFRMNKDTIG